MRPKTHTLLTSFCCAGVMLLLGACSSKHKIRGIPDKLPDISLAGTTATPAHSMPGYEYPFDSQGRYVQEWAAEGERRAGRSAAPTRVNPTPVTRWRQTTSSTRSKAVASNRSKAPASKSKSTAKAKPKSGGSSSYTVKKGDTLSGIARRNNTTVAKIKAANGLKSDLLNIGKGLRIPR